MPHNSNHSPLIRRLGSSLVLALVAIVALAAITTALGLTYADGEWHNVQGDSGLPTCLRYGNTPATDDENTVGYGYRSGTSCPPEGDPPDFSKQSGFGFDGADLLSFDAGESFLLGELTHYNRPILASSYLTEVDLLVTLDFGDPDPLLTTLTYTMQLDESPNNASP